MLPLRKKIPFRRAFAYIFLSVCLVWGSIFIAWYFHLLVLQKRQHDPAFQIQGVFQKHRSEKVPKRVFTEVLGLFHDKTPNLYTFDIKNAQKTLEDLSIFKKVHIKKIWPAFLYVDYETRTPELIAGDFDNIGLDRSGVCFPLYPFYSEKRLPRVFFGLETVPENGSLAGDGRFCMALAVIDAAKNLLGNSFRIDSVDVHALDASSLGKRYIVLSGNVQNKKIVLRLPFSGFAGRLKDFQKILSIILSESYGEATIDFRCKDIAIIKGAI